MKITNILTITRTLFYSFVIGCLLFVASEGDAQSYRTFTQDSLALKKTKAGKAIGSVVCFTLYNGTDTIVNGLEAKFNAAVIAVLDSGGFTTFELSGRGKYLVASGRTVDVGDSVTLCLRVSKKSPGTKASYWFWTIEGKRKGVRHFEYDASTDEQVYSQPNGGNVLEFLYKKVITRPNGVVMGVPDSSDVGWIRYMKADRKYFPHTASPRCFDFITTGNGGERIFLGQLRNPKVKKHNNHLLGELHALRLAIIANDSAVTEPVDSTATPFGDLIYNDTVNSEDPLNGMTLRQIASLGDSALTYCTKFSPSLYASLDAVVSRINKEFDGPYAALSSNPLLLAGTKSLSEVYYLHANPSAVPTVRVARGDEYAMVDDVPERFELQQNYPNPFNPSTSIDFTLVEPSIVTLKVFNLLGQEVATLVNNELLDEGEQSVEFVAGNLPSGVYFYKIDIQSAGDGKKIFHSVKRMALMK